MTNGRPHATTQGPLSDLYAVFEGLRYRECTGCCACCAMPWLLSEELAVLGARFQDDIEVVGPSTHVVLAQRCRFAVNDRCEIYPVRPLDCRMFPMDLVRDGSEYWWVLFTTCPRHMDLRERLEARIDRIESLLTAQLLDQYARQIEATAAIYAPLRDGQFVRLRPLERPFTRTR